jgi:phosphate/phosphite/phosphonate ABC transporter binding protein
MGKSLEFKVIGVVFAVLLFGAVAAGFMAVSMQKTALHSITQSTSMRTADIVLKEIEMTMLEGKADFTKAIVAKLKEAQRADEITVLNSEGGEAFLKDSPARESHILTELKAGKNKVLQREENRVTLYMPLKNEPSCRPCHGAEKPVLGAVKFSASFHKEYSEAATSLYKVIAGSVIAVACFSLLIWAMLRKMVISPVKSINSAADRIAEGDLSFDVTAPGDDEIGNLSRMFKESFRSLWGIFQRIKEQSGRISKVTESVEKESRQLIRGAEVEAEAFDNISSGVDELTAAATGISGNTEALASSVGESSAAIEQMVSSIKSVNDSIHELTEAVESTSSSIAELSATIKEVASGAERLAGASEETLSAISEITTAVKEVELSARESARLSEKVTSDAATFGMASIEKTIEGMRDIKSSVEHSADFIKKLGGRSVQIGKILTVIDEVTDQTTLLALNAAILAAQAGEHGKGFSVVADEIKALAERTALSTKEISSLIQAVQREVGASVAATQEGLGSVEEGFRLSKEAGDALKKILESSRKSSEMALSIERSTTEQSKAAKLVTEAMERVRGMTDQIAKATSEESAGVLLIMKATEKMRDAAQQVSKSTEEQTMSSRQISHAMELVFERSRQIAKALSEHKVATQHISNVIEGLRGIPVENRKLAFRVSTALRDLHKDSELLGKEMEHLKFSEKMVEVVKFGVLPLESPALMFKKYKPLADYLAGKLGKRVELKVGVDFESTIKDLGENVTQLCALGATTYVGAHKRYGIRVIVKGLRDGKPYHRAVIITRADSDMQSLKDLKGRTFAFGDLQSAASHIVPRTMLKDSGVDLKDLQFYHYLGHHDEVAQAVLNGDFDAGAVIETVADKYKDQGLRFVKFSDAIPELNICSNVSLSEKDLSIIKSSLVSLKDSSPEGAQVLKSIDEHYTGFAEAHDSDYEGIRLKMSNLGML